MRGGVPMLLEAIRSRLVERFGEALTEFHRRRIVFWHDESGEFAEQVDGLSLEGVTVIKLTGRNNFAVQKLLTVDDLTGDYLVYNPISYDKPRDNWLLDIELYSGEPFRADLVSMQMAELNIEATSAMRKTVKLYDRFFNSQERKAKLRRIGRDYHTPLALHTDIMAVLCGLNGGTSQDVIIAVLSAGLDMERNSAIKSIASFGNCDVFWQMVQKFTGYAGGGGGDLRGLYGSPPMAACYGGTTLALRATPPREGNGGSACFGETTLALGATPPREGNGLGWLACHVLVTALSQTMSAGALRGLERFISESCAAYCYQLVREWMAVSPEGSVAGFRLSDGGDAGDGTSDQLTITDQISLFEICRYVERELRLAGRFDKIDIDVLLKSDTFPAINESILKRFFAAISERIIRVDDILRAVENRRTAAWYGLSSSYFDCLHYIAKMQEFYLAHIEGFHIVEPKGVWKFYTGEGFQMDSYYRHFHHAFAKTLKSANPLLDDLLKKSAEVVEGLYHQWFLKELNAAWTGAIADDLKMFGYVSAIPKQRDFYRNYVAPAVDRDKRVFVVISDALRYEVAAELAENLSRTTRGRATIESVLAIFPGVSKFGMAALLPGKAMSLNEKCDVLMDGKLTSDTVCRGALLKIANADSVAVTYNELLQMKQQERRELVKDKEVVYIYHNAIDATGEKLPTETKVFEACETAINELSGIVRIIVNDLSSTNIFVTADHGFLYTYKPLEESDKISRQAFVGDVFEFGRRYALVAPDTTVEYLLPVNVAREIGGMPLIGFAPQDTIRIKAQGGGGNYVHGGISLQEMVVPVVVYKGMRKEYKNYVEVRNPGLMLISESRKVANLMFSLDFLQKEAVGDKIQPCIYAVFFTDDEGAAVSDRQTVIADRSSANASERVFRVRFNLKAGAYDGKRIYRLVVANDTDAPEEVEFRIDVPFGGDFGFDPPSLRG